MLVQLAFMARKSIYKLGLRVMDRRLSRATSSSKQNRVKSCPVFYVVIKPRQGPSVTQIASYVGVKGSIKKSSR